MQFLTNLRKDKRLFIGLLLILICPVLWINQTGFHDWGGDFAQYIQQAINIAEGKSLSETHYILNPDYQLVGPSTYPPGFSLLLSPVYAIWGNSIRAFTVFVSVCFFVCGVLTFLILQTRFSSTTSLIGALVFSYNPLLIRFKAEILSDIPFTMVTMIGLLWHLKMKRRSFLSALFLGLLIGFAMSIKSLAIVFLPAVAMEGFFQDRLRETWKYVTSLSVAAILMYFFLNQIIFPVAEDPYRFFAGTLTGANFYDLVLSHLEYFFKVLQYFFHPENSVFEFIGIYVESAALVFLIIGLAQEWVQKKDVLLFYVVIFVFGLLIFPYSGRGGFRYLLPVIPLFLYFIILGLKEVRFFEKRNRLILRVAVILVFFSLYKSELTRIFSNPAIPDGPQSELALDAFNFIQNNTTENAVILFTKPRVLGLYGQRDSWTPAPDHDSSDINKSIEKLGGNYVLKYEGLPNAAIDKVIRQIANEEPIFKNDRFQLYRVNQ